MEQDSEKAESVVAVGAEVHKSCAGGLSLADENTVSAPISNTHWYAAVVKSNYERLCREQLEKQGFETYIASQKEVHVYKNRTRREVEKMVIKGIVFVRFKAGDYLQVLKSSQFINYLLTDRAGQPNEYGRRPLALIPDSQLQRLQFMLYHAENPVSFTDRPLRLGDKVRVARGQLQGLEGTVLRSEGTAYIVVTLDLLGSAMTSIALSDVEKV